MGFFIRVEPDVKIFVEDLNPEGSNTILFIHGWPGNHKLFEYQFNMLPKLGFRCIGIDYRGFGQSDKPWHGYGYDRLSDDVRCVIDTLKLKDIALLGHSTGGGIAVRYMARHGGHGIAKLALCAAAAPSLVKRSYFPYGLPRQDVIDIIRHTYTDRPQMLRDFGKMIFYKPVSQAMSDWIFHLGLQAAGWSTVSIAETWLDEEGLFSDLAQISVPTLIMQGIHDRVVLPALSEVQHNSIKNSMLVPFKESGHFLFIDQKEMFTDELARFAGD
ncbi:MAG: Arylesterase [Firmicutes bacterium ADurb.Bin182]|nr:MAG: Arylesterase [Firmicutes bacterium ADurb.Bin182]